MGSASKCVAPVTALVFSMVFVFLFAYSALLMKRFSPVYTPVECVNTEKTFNFTVNETGAYVTAFTKMECTNPNAFSVEIEKGRPGRVFFHPEMIDIGHVVLGAYALTQGGTGTMKADVALHIRPEEIPILLQGEKHILEEMHVNAVAYLNVLGFNIPYRFHQLNTCGFGMKIFPETMNYTTGPAICATSQDDLLRKIPSLYATPAPFQIGVGAEHLNKAEQMRDAGCGSAMGVSALLALFFLRYGLVSICGNGKAAQFLRDSSSLIMGSSATLHGLPDKTATKTAEPCPEPEKNPANVV